MKGWIRKHRRIINHWLYDDDRVFSRYEAFDYLLMIVNHQDKKVMFDGKLVLVERGSTITSIRKLCERWKWSNTKVVQFLDALEQDEMITKKSDSKKTVITIVNYSKYQGSGDDENDAQTTEKRHENDTETIQKHTNNNVNNDKEIKHIGDSDECAIAFEQFWKAYPKKQGKAPALQKWQSFWNKKQIDFGEVMSGLERYLAYIDHERTVRRFDRQYMDGKTWINQRQWESEWKIEIAPVKTSGKTPPATPLKTVTEEEQREHDKLMERIRERNRQQGRTVREYSDVSPNV